jgi:hypothetical protein
LFKTRGQLLYGDISVAPFWTFLYQIEASSLSIDTTLVGSNKQASISKAQ